MNATKRQHEIADIMENEMKCVIIVGIQLNDICLNKNISVKFTTKKLILIEGDTFVSIFSLIVFMSTPVR